MTTLLLFLIGIVRAPVALLHRALNAVARALVTKQQVKAEVKALQELGRKP